MPHDEQAAEEGAVPEQTFLFPEFPAPSAPNRASRGVVPRPFLKWAGGKGQLLDELVPRAAQASPFNRYHEPFLGGAALFFALHREDRLGHGSPCLSDTNPNLVRAYLGLRNECGAVIDLLKGHKQRHGKEYYYAMRASEPGAIAESAARIVYLNKTCFNGLYRENSKGRFNVPMGKYKDPIICDEANLRAVSEALQKARIERRSFESVLDHAQPGDFVYFDPPYVPLSQTASFTSYDSSGFGPEDQQRLADVYAELDKRGVKVMLSNSMTDVVRGLYKNFTIHEVQASRPVNSKADRRGKVAEALVTNF